MPTSLEKISEYKNYQVKRTLLLEEIRSELIELVHMPTGAKISYLKNDDPENVFCIGLQTYPADSTGVAHMLEHIVLCGSKKYPVKDPFFSMTRRSLNTFMNAFTGADFTLYPASSMVEKDFYNLLDVYLDAVFFPELKKISFNQEGHRLEIDDKEQLVFKGVVFNEMKGAMSSPDQRLWDKLYKYLLPDLPYSFNSGGDPEEIINLSYEELKEFHKVHYHPSTAHFYFYGNFPIEKHLDFLEEKVFSHFTKKDPLPPMPFQKRFTKPKFIKETFPSTDQTDGILALSFLCAQITDYEDVLALTVLDSLLMDTDASLLKKPLLDSGLCKEVGSYLDTEMSEIPWNIIFKGVEEKNREKLHKLVFATLKDIAKKPLPEEDIQDALHQIEFMRSEIVGDRMPYGLVLYMRAFLACPHGARPEHNLKIHSLFKKLEEKIKDKMYFSNLIEKYMITNNHLLDLLMMPDASKAKEELEKEKKLLEKISLSLDESKKEQIKKEAKELKAYQESQDTENINLLPTVKLEDISKEARDYPLEIKKYDNFTCFFSDCFTNDIVYLNLIFPLPKIDKEDFFFLSLFTSFLTEVGTKDFSYEECLKQVQAYTGGFYASLSFESPIEEANKVLPSIKLRIKGFTRHTEKLFSLLKNVAFSADFSDKKRLKQLLLQLYTSLENSLTEGSMRYAKYRSLAPFSSLGTIQEELYGLSFFNNLEKLVKNLDTEMDSLIKKFVKFKDIFLQKDFEMLVTCNKKQYDLLEEKDFYEIDQSASKTLDPWDNTLVPSKIPSSLIINSSPVAFTSFAMPSIGYTDKDSAALLVATELLENIYLHEEIREKGGAYGSGANYLSYCNNFTFYGYRDPHIKETLEHFKKSVETIIKGSFTKQDLFEAKLGIFQGIDSPLPPKSRGPTAYHWHKVGKTLKIRQQYRDQIFAVTKEDIQIALESHVLSQFVNGIFTSFSSKNMLEKETEKLSPKMLIQEIRALST